MKKPAKAAPRTTSLVHRTTAARSASGVRGPTKRELAARVKAALGVLAEHVSSAETAAQRIATYLVTTVFEGDWKTALAEPSTNPVWVELRGRVPTPDVRLSQDALGRMLRVGAWDACIAHRGWDDLPITFKQLLLPLGDRQRLLSAALHVTRMNLDTDGVRNYLAANVDDPSRAGPTTARVKKQAAGIALLATPRARDAFLTKARALPDDRRDALRKELEAARDALSDVLGELE